MSGPNYTQSTSVSGRVCLEKGACALVWSDLYIKEALRYKARVKHRECRTTFDAEERFKSSVLEILSLLPECETLNLWSMTCCVTTFYHFGTDNNNLCNINS